MKKHAEDLCSPKPQDISETHIKKLKRERQPRVPRWEGVVSLTAGLRKALYTPRIPGTVPTASHGPRGDLRDPAKGRRSPNSLEM